MEWYTPIQLPGSVTVTGKSSQLEQLAGDVAVSYLAAAAQVRQTGAVEGRYLRLRKLMSQLFDHGGFGYDAIPGMSAAAEHRGSVQPLAVRSGGGSRVRQRRTERCRRSACTNLG